MTAPLTGSMIETLTNSSFRLTPRFVVPLVAAALLDGAVDREALRARLTELQARLMAVDAVLKLPPQGLDRALSEGLAPLMARGLVVEGDAGLVAAPDAVAMLKFYAAPVLQVLGAASAI